MAIWPFFAILLASLLPCYAVDVAYSYDTLGRVTRVDYPGGNSTFYSYDAAGNRTAVSISVLPAAPVAVPDSKATTANTAVTYDPRANDSDPNGYALTIIAAGAPLHGGVGINGGVSLTYTPAPGYTGTDTFLYTISNGHGGQASALDTITINAPVAPPVANPDLITTDFNTPKTFDPRLNDSGDGITITGTPIASHGMVVNNSGISVTYTPTMGYSGADSFTYTITDVHSQTAGSIVSVTVNPPPPPGPPAPDAYLEYPNPPRAHTFDPRAAPGITVTAVSTPSHGTAVILSGGTGITYTANAGYHGTDTFTYTVTDSMSNSNTGNVYITLDEP